MKTLGPVSPTAWDAWAAEGRVSHMVSDSEVDQFIRHVPDRRGRVAVDAGCGMGKFSRRLRAFGYDVTGVDFSPVSLDIARRGGHGFGLRYVHHDLDAGDPPALPVRGVDLVVCREVLPFLTDPEGWLERVRTQWLRPAGQAYLVVPPGEEQRLQRGQMTKPAVARLCEGWSSAVRYDLGPLTCLVLRSPAS
ncbi:class I SAM-dependent methyltransferase [Streptomyces sp. NPDC002730]|uniref:class I SAM-dependent methyltransferase n=1 Tax=Streptomyces sp. NPDC002730 TaxID=3364662 RepID=UPI0036884C65